MVIRLNENYEATLNNALLGYVGETNARPVSFEGMEVDGADRYILTIDYGDGVEYEVDITDGIWTPTADILRSAQTVSCQIAAKKLSGQEYILVKKSRIFRLRIGAAIGDTAIPSPDVAMDALDRIDAIGRQAHADMQTAATAAETATTMSDNAAKSATAAGVSADTATQAASRAETAQTAAETSATQADTARQGAETARAEAVTAQNAAKVSAAQAATSAKQTTADKTATAGYAETAKTNADSTAADRQAVQTLAEQVTTDKAAVAENTAKVATDRTAAETAAQTAQAVADSLPDDYVTAVGKIAENTAEIGRVKLTDKELQRRVNALYDMGQGITHQFETDTDTAYQKAVPTGAKLMSVKSVGGRSVVWNQLVKPVPAAATQVGVKFTFSSDGIVTLSGTATTTGNAVSLQSVKNQKGHKYLMFANPLSDFYGVDKLMLSSQSFGRDTTGQGVIITNESSNAVWYYTIYVYEGVTYDNVKIRPQIFDLTQMFGAGNEPTSVEEFEKMFPADYYPYCAGEIVSAGTEKLVEQGANLFLKTDETSNNAYMLASYAPANEPLIAGETYTATICITPGEGLDHVSLCFSGGYISLCSFTVNGTDKQIISRTFKAAYITGREPSVNPAYGYADFYRFPNDGTITTNTTMHWIKIEKGDTPTAYAPYHQTAYQIPEAIKSLPGYGWSAGTARNYIDYENKKYVQCVNSVDLGTKNWLMYKDGDYTPFFYLDSISDIRGGTSNFLCPKYQYTKIGVIGNESGLYVSENAIVRVRDTAYTDATTFKQAMQGVMLYHELATPIVTDISTMIDDDFLRNIEVEAGGSVTFKGSNDSYRIPVPSEEEYVVKLSEVGGSV